MSACRVVRCSAPAEWRVSSSRTSPTDARPFAASYCGQHAGQLLAVPTTVEVKRIGAGR